MSVLSDKLNDVFINIHNKFVDLNRNKADKDEITELQTDVSLLEDAQEWELIGEAAITDADAGAEGIVIDLGKPIESWYKETRTEIYIPASKAYNSVNGGLFLCMGNTEANALNTSHSGSEKGNCMLVKAQSSYAPIRYSNSNKLLVFTSWEDDKPIYSLVMDCPYDAIAYPYTVHGTTGYKYSNIVIGKQFIGVKNALTTATFKFPKGTTVKMYGRGKV